MTENPKVAMRISQKNEQELERCLRGLQTIKSIIEDLLDTERRHGPVREVSGEKADVHGPSAVTTCRRETLLDMHRMPGEKTK